MLKLKNIKLNNSTISCEAFPEDCKTPCNMVFDIEKKEVTRYELPKEYEYCRIFDIPHARQFFKELDLENVPDNKLLMWY